MMNMAKQIGVLASGGLTTVAIFLCLYYLIKREVIARAEYMSAPRKNLISVVLLAPLAIGVVATICGSAASLTDFKLAPEPDNGIKVVINYVSSEAA
jgi:nitrate reductase gamma subunit